MLRGGLGFGLRLSELRPLTRSLQDDKTLEVLDFPGRLTPLNPPGRPGGNQKNFVCIDDRNTSQQKLRIREYYTDEDDSIAGLGIGGCGIDGVCGGLEYRQGALVD